jgi:hypothetical protein
MPTDTDASAFQHTSPQTGRRTGGALPPGAGLALAVMTGTVIWGAVLALFLL